jgi:nucleoid-associated protein YgaU
MRKLGTLVGLALFALAGTARAQEEAAAPAPEAAATPAGDAATPASETAPAAPADAAAAGEKLTIGADAAFQLPLGNFADATGMGFGALVRGEFNVIPKLNITFRTGYIYSLGKEILGVKYSVANIPAWAGGKYFITDMFYGAAEVGMNMFMSKVSGELFGVSMDTTSTDYKFGATIGAGALLGPLDVKAQFEILSLADAGDSMAIMVNVGYNFLKLM